MCRFLSPIVYLFDSSQQLRTRFFVELCPDSSTLIIRQSLVGRVMTHIQNISPFTCFTPILVLLMFLFYTLVNRFQRTVLQKYRKKV